MLGWIWNTIGMFFIVKTLYVGHSIYVPEVFISYDKMDLRSDLLCFEIWF